MVRGEKPHKTASLHDALTRTQLGYTTWPHCHLTATLELDTPVMRTKGHRRFTCNGLFVHQDFHLWKQRMESKLRLPAYCLTLGKSRDLSLPTQPFTRGILAQVSHPQAGAGGERLTQGFLELGVLSDRCPPSRTRHTRSTGNRQTHPFNAQLSLPQVPKTELFLLV